MKTIPIGKQASISALANAVTTALAAAIGWTAEENADGNLTGNVKKSGINIFFRVYTAGTTKVVIGVSNGYVTAAHESSYAYVDYNASKTYNLYVLESSGGSIAVGANPSDVDVKLWSLITRNSAGEYVGGVIGGSSASPLKTVRGIETATRNIDLSANNNSTAMTSIVKLPDIWGAAMFNDLYYVVSCPYQSRNLVFTIGGKNYRSIGTSSAYMVLAFPEN